MEPRQHRDGGVGDDAPWQWYRGLPIRKRVLAAALHFVAGFVLLLAAYFPLAIEAARRRRPCRRPGVHRAHMRGRGALVLAGYRSRTA